MDGSSALAFAALSLSFLAFVVSVLRFSFGLQLDVSFDSEDSLVFENTDRDPLPAKLQLRLDVLDDRRGFTKVLDVYHLEIPSGGQRVFRHSIPAYLNAMGYHQSISHLVRIRGLIRPAAFSRFLIARRFHKEYKRIRLEDGAWLSVDVTSGGNRSASPAERRSLFRKNIPDELREENEADSLGKRGAG